ncbi:MAG: hypothetical protein M1825_005517 [Sarcosagium campestre]|nr:MAG: hypothetical protein M1825_005517 [Sarcosagium campestre]
MQGFNMGRYVPPEHEGTTSGNKLAGKHALGSRARKLPQGILTVRFEMPFAVWCNHCPKPTIIGQGVRFNAEKKRIGNYFSTPIYSFRLKHTACGGTIEIRTDPQNTAYVVESGGKKRDTGDDKPPLEGEISLATDEERARIRDDAFASLEGKMDDKKRAVQEHDRVLELQRLRQRDWADPYAGSRRLRHTFRQERKIREADVASTEALRDRMALDIELLPATETDVKRAGMVEFGTVSNSIDALDNDHAIRAKPLFPLETIKLSGEDDKRSEAKRIPQSSSQRREHRSAFQKLTEKAKKAKKKKNKHDKAAAEAARRKEALGEELRGNTRAGIDPFLSSIADKGWGPRPQGARLIPGIKSKSKKAANDDGMDDSSKQAGEEDQEVQRSESSARALGLAGYDSE